MKRFLESVDRFDKEVSEQLHDFEYNPLQSFFLSYTTLGSLHFTALLALILFQTGYLNVLKDLAVVLTISLAITELIKKIVKRGRPATRDKDIYVLQNLSFPSGHSVNAFATATVLTGVAGLGYLPVAVAALVAFSRVYLGQHYLTDVLVGSGIGVAVAYLVIVL